MESLKRVALFIYRKGDDEVENSIKLLIGLTGASVNYLWGEWTVLLGVLLLFVVLDYASGLVTAFLKKELNSETGFKGIAEKVLFLPWLQSVIPWIKF